MNTPIGMVVLVTGASSGIGRATALEFGLLKSRVAVLAQGGPALEEVVSQIEERGGQALALVADVSDRRQVESAVKCVLDRWGRIDVLVNNAGYLVLGSVENCLVEDFERQIAVNYLGAVYLTKAVLPAMRLQGSGSIINVSSISGIVYVPYNAAYQASKAALRAFTVTLRRELLGSGILVSLVSPGRVDTGIVDQGTLRNAVESKPLSGEMPAEQVARLIIDCIQRPRREVIVPFILKPLAIAYTLLPEVVESGLPWLQEHWAAWRSRRRSVTKEDATES